MSIVEGFGGMRIVGDKLSFVPQIPKQWKSYAFKVNFRDRIISVSVDATESRYHLSGETPMSIRVRGEKVVLSPNDTVALSHP